MVVTHQPNAWREVPMAILDTQEAYELLLDTLGRIEQMWCRDRPRVPARYIARQKAGFRADEFSCGGARVAADWCVEIR
jgi:hypothetical protein